MIYLFYPNTQIQLQIKMMMMMIMKALLLFIVSDFFIPPYICLGTNTIQSRAVLLSPVTRVIQLQKIIFVYFI